MFNCLSFRQKVMILAFTAFFLTALLFSDRFVNLLEEAHLMRWGFFLTLFFSVVMGMILFKISRAMRQMVIAIRAYSVDLANGIPYIQVGKSTGHEFNLLASTLSSISARLSEQRDLIVEERDEKESILEALVEGVVVVDPEGLVRYANQTAAKMLMIPRKQLVGKWFSPLSNSQRGELFERCKTVLHLAQVQATVLTDSIALVEGQKIYLDLIEISDAVAVGLINGIHNFSARLERALN